MSAPTAPRFPKSPILLVASAVAPLGSGAAGGVTHMVRMVARLLRERGIESAVMAPKGSHYCKGPLIEIAGTPQPTLASPEISADWPMAPGAVIGQMWTPILEAPHHWGLILSFQHDWLPFYLSHALGPRLLHIPNMGLVNEATDLEIRRMARAHPERVAFVSRSQADAFGALDDAPILKPGLDLSLYPFAPEPEAGTAIWAGRIAPEKGLMEAAAAAHAAGKRLKVAGAVTDDAYFDRVRAAFPETLDYLGFLDQPALAAALGSAEAMLLTQNWAEAFGILSIEALAVGTPLVAVDRGANRQFVRPGETGYLVPADDPAAAAEALNRAAQLPRTGPRTLVERDYSLEAMGRDLDAWFARQPRHAL